MKVFLDVVNWLGRQFFVLHLHHDSTYQKNLQYDSTVKFSE